MRSSGGPSPEQQIVFRNFSLCSMLHHITIFIWFTLQMESILFKLLIVGNGDFIILQSFAAAGKNHISAAMSCGIIKAPFIPIGSLHCFCKCDGLRILFCSGNSFWKYFVFFNGCNHPVIYVHCGSISNHGQVMVTTHPKLISLTLHIICAVSLLDFPNDTLRCYIPVTPAVGSSILAIIFRAGKSLAVKVIHIITALVAIKKCQLKVYHCLIGKACINCIMLLICGKLSSGIHTYPVLNAVATV